MNARLLKTFFRYQKDFNVIFSFFTIIVNLYFKYKVLLDYIFYLLSLTYNSKRKFMQAYVCYSGLPIARRPLNFFL